MTPFRENGGCLCTILRHKGSSDAIAATGGRSLYLVVFSRLRQPGAPCQGRLVTGHVHCLNQAVEMTTNRGRP
jgi:hypothetical protein